MPFNLETWKTQLQQNLSNWRPRMQRAGVNSTYAFLSAAALWPVVEQAQHGNWAALAALGGVLGNLGGNLLANQIQGWKDESDAAHKLTTELQAASPEREALLAELDAVLEALDALRLAQENLAPDEQPAVMQSLAAELKHLNSRLSVPTISVGSGAAAVGKNAKAVGAGGVLIEGGVGGDFIQGNHTTLNLPPGTQLDINPAASAAERRAEAARQAAYRRYLERLQRHCQSLPLAAIGGEDSGGEEINLDSVYIDLDTTTRVKLTREEQAKRPPRPQSLGVEGAASGEETRPLTALEAAEKAPRLVLLGAPGAGKSTFVHKLLAWQAAAHLDAALAPPPGFERHLLPVLILLRDLARRLETLNLQGMNAEQQRAVLAGAVQAQILAELELYQAGEMAEQLQTALQDGACLLALDGLDEVPQDLRRRVRQAVSAALHVYCPQRVIITCRVRSYNGEAVLPGFTPHTLADFDEDKINAFARAWYCAQRDLGKFNAAQADSRAGDLARAALGSDLRELAANPMLLTSMAIVHQKEIGLPGERVRLYDLVVDVLVQRWQQHKLGEGELAPSPGLAAFFRDSLRLRPALEHLAYEAHRAARPQSGAANTEQLADLSRGQALALLEAPAYLGSAGLADEFLDYVDQRTGLLVGRGGDLERPTSYSFPHRTFQEYLAGCHLLANQRSLGRDFYAHAAEGDYWHLAAQLGCEELLYNRRGAQSLLDLVYQLCPPELPPDAAGQRAVLWAGLATVRLGREAVEQDAGGPTSGKDYLQRLLPHLVDLLASPQLPAIERAEAGRVLGKLGDRRPAATSLEGMEFCQVPGGPFLMGSREEHDKKAEDIENPQHELDLPGYWIGRYPITQAQFAAFVEAGGYRNAAYWSEAIQAGRWKDGQIKGYTVVEGKVIDKQADRPHDYGEPFNLPNHPVVGISWYEALAFTRWLTSEWQAKSWLPKDWGVRLPSEAEWEKAARGGLHVPQQTLIRPAQDGLESIATALALQTNSLPERIYPWGDTFNPQHANTSENGIGASSAIGCFPAGIGPYGALEMIGSVWEWTHSLWGRDWQKPDYSYPYKAGDGREKLDAGDNILRVIRGGSFYNNQEAARCARRVRNYPDDRDDYIGFRCVCSPL